MFRLIRYILSVNRGRRSWAVGLALRLLRLVRDIEKDEMYRCSDMLDEFSPDSNTGSHDDYIVIEEECSVCECVLGFLESAIEDLEFAY